MAFLRGLGAFAGGTAHGLRSGYDIVRHLDNQKLAGQELDMRREDLGMRKKLFARKELDWKRDDDMWKEFGEYINSAPELFGYLSGGQTQQRVPSLPARTFPLAPRPEAPVPLDLMSGHDGR
jgi:hypothetical protein